MGAALCHCHHSAGPGADKTKFSESAGVPPEAMVYSDFIAEGAWDGVDDVLRDVYKEASEKLGREFKYPKDK